MHIVVPTIDLLNLIHTLKPIRTIKTVGHDFPIYTLIATDDKLKLIVSDKLSITASMEVFAQIKKPGKLSVNGRDLYSTVVQTKPYSNSDGVGSKEYTLKADDSKLYLKTDIFYGRKSILQTRSLSRINADLSNMERQDFNMAPISIKIENLNKILATLARIITSDAAGEIGQSILLRMRKGALTFVATDGVLVVEVAGDSENEVPDFDLLLPRQSCSMLSNLIMVGDILQIQYNTHQAKFLIDNHGLNLSFITSLIIGDYINYENIFNDDAFHLITNTKILWDNLNNINKTLGDESWRTQIEIMKSTLRLSNLVKGHYDFTNEGIPAVIFNANGNKWVVNSLLLSGLVSIVASEEVKLTVDSSQKLLRVYSTSGAPYIRGALGLNKED